MKIITSVAPKNIETQKTAIRSWINLGFEVYSINTKEESEFLKKSIEEIKYVDARETAKDLYEGYNVPYPNLLEILDFCFLSKESVWIINSDIILDTNKTTIKNLNELSKESLVFGHRVNFDDSLSNKQSYKLYKDGFDWFIINNKFKYIFTTRMKQCIGQPFWDYWLPLTFIRKGLKPILCLNKIAFHKNHDVNWDSSQLFLFGKLLAREMGHDIGDVQDMSLFTQSCNLTIKKESIQCNLNQ